MSERLSKQIGHNQQQMDLSVCPLVLWPSHQATHTQSFFSTIYLSISVGHNLEGRWAVIAFFCPSSTVDLLLITA